MKFTYLSLFPDYFHNYYNISIVKKSLEKKLFSYQVYNIRDFANNGKVDDYPYGGGGGLILKIEPLFYLIDYIKKNNKNALFLLMSPRGNVFSQNDVLRLLSITNELVFICGRYEGIDQRIENYIDEEISVGSFVTMGGEIPSLLITDCLVRFIPGVIKKESYLKDSFNFFENKNLFDFDCYTRPKEFDGFSVPEVLLSGNHYKIYEWRKKNQRKKSKKF